MMTDPKILALLERLYNGPFAPDWAIKAVEEFANDVAEKAYNDGLQDGELDEL